MWQQHLTRRKHSQTVRVATSPQRLAFFILGPRIIHFLFCLREQLCIPVQILSCPQFPHHPLTSSEAPSGRQETLCPTPSNTGYGDQQVPCGPHYWLNLTDLDIIYCVNWAVVPSWAIWAYNKLHSSSAWPQPAEETASSKQIVKSRTMVTSPWTMCMPRFLQAMQLKAPRHQELPKKMCGCDDK